VRAFAGEKTSGRYLTSRWDDPRRFRGMAQRYRGFRTTEHQRCRGRETTPQLKRAPRSQRKIFFNRSGDVVRESSASAWFCSLMGQHKRSA